MQLTRNSVERAPSPARDPREILEEKWAAFFEKQAYSEFIRCYRQGGRRLKTRPAAVRLAKSMGYVIDVKTITRHETPGRRFKVEPTGELHAIAAYLVVPNWLIEESFRLRR